MVYGAIDLLEGLMRPEWTVFEFGSGNSTLWLSRRVRRVLSVEHDAAWADRLTSSLPRNVDVRVVDIADPTAYPDAFLEFAASSDVAIIDGRRRSECAERIVTAGSHLSVIVFDNSDRQRYSQALASLRSLGMREAVFHGLAPGLGQPSQTTVFFR
jgi:hypothetical protein